MGMRLKDKAIGQQGVAAPMLRDDRLKRQLSWHHSSPEYQCRLNQPLPLVARADTSQSARRHSVPYPNRSAAIILACLRGQLSLPVGDGVGHWTTPSGSHGFRDLKRDDRVFAKPEPDPYRKACPIGRSRGLAWDGGATGVVPLVRCVAFKAINKVICY